MQYCFNSNFKCICNKNITDHQRSFVHGNGRLNISISIADTQLKMDTSFERNVILMWSFCKTCRNVTPFTRMSHNTWNYSFGKFLELSFYAFLPHSKNAKCGHSIHKNHIRYFYWNDLVMRL